MSYEFILVDAQVAPFVAKIQEEESPREDL